VAKTFFPVADVTVAKKFVVTVGVKPNMGSKALLVVFGPLSRVFLVGRNPVHYSLSIALVMSPGSLVEVARLVTHFSLAPLHSVLPQTIVD